MDLTEKYVGKSGVHNPNLLFLRKEVGNYRILALQGGTRSGKTYSALQYIISLCQQYTGMVISICRAAFPPLKATALKDFIEILQSVDLYSERMHRKGQSSHEYVLNGNVIEFFSIDNEQKVRGRKRHMLYINEANEVEYDKFRQLAFRTEGKIIIDYNPSDADGFIYDDILTREDCAMLVTTYKDNPHLPQAIIDEIEILRLTDPDYWKVFGEGQRAGSRTLIYTHYQITKTWPSSGEVMYGLDFGYSAPSALTEVRLYDNSHYVKELLYKPGLTNPELIQTVGKFVNKKALIFADAAEPDRIMEFRKAGFNVVTARKEIEDGILAVKSKPLFIWHESANLIKEIRNYKFKKHEATGLILEEPLKFNDHLMDSMRYPIFTYSRKNTTSITHRR